MIRNRRSAKKANRFLGYPVLSTSESRLRNDRQTLFAITRELVHAQFVLADYELTNRLWQDVVDRGIDIERITNLMYGCCSHEDEKEMLYVDKSYENRYL